MIQNQIAHFTFRFLFNDEQINQDNLKELSKKSTYIPGLQQMSEQELKKNLQLAFDAKHYFLISQLLTYLLEINTLQKEEQLQFIYRKIDILLYLMQYEKAQEFTEKRLKILEQEDSINMDYLILKCLYGEILCYQNDPINGFMNVLRAQGLFYLLSEQTPEEYQIIQYFIDKLAKSVSSHNQFIDFIMYMDSKIQNQSLQIIPHLRGRIVKQVACGTNHVIAQIESCLCYNAYQIYDKVCKGPTQCNQGIEIFGWGSNIFGQINNKAPKNFYEFPILNYELTKMDINGLFASKNMTIGYRKDGVIYEFGEGVIERQERIFIVDDLLRLFKGENFYLYQNFDKKCFIKGSINLNSEIKQEYIEPQQILSNDQEIFNYISIGSNHIILIDSIFRIHIFGDNSNGQLGIQSQQEQFIKEFRILDIQQKQFQIIFTNNECSFFITSKGKIYYAGKILQNERESKLQQVFISDDAKIQNICILQDAIYAFSDIGNCYCWIPKYSSRFTKFDTQNQLFDKMFATDHNIFFTRKIYPASFYQIEQITQNPRTYQPIKFVMRIQDDEKTFKSFKGFYPFRIYFFLSPIMRNIQDVLVLQAKQKWKEMQGTQIENKIYFFELSNLMIDKIQVTVNENNAKELFFEFEIQQSEEYFLVILINEQIIINGLRLEVIESLQEEIEFEQKCFGEEKKLILEQTKIKKEIFNENKGKINPKELKNIENQIKQAQQIQEQQLRKIKEKEQNLQKKVQKEIKQKTIKIEKIKKEQEQEKSIEKEIEQQQIKADTQIKSIQEEEQLITQEYQQIDQEEQQITQQDSIQLIEKIDINLKQESQTIVSDSQNIITQQSITIPPASLNNITQLDEEQITIPLVLQNSIPQPLIQDTPKIDLQITTKNPDQSLHLSVKTQTAQDIYIIPQRKLKSSKFKSQSNQTNLNSQKQDQIEIKEKQIQYSQKLISLPKLENSMTFDKQNITNIQFQNSILQNSNTYKNKVSLQKKNIIKKTLTEQTDSNLDKSTFKQQIKQLILTNTNRDSSQFSDAEIFQQYLLQKQNQSIQQSLQVHKRTLPRLKQPSLIDLDKSQILNINKQCVPIHKLPNLNTNNQDNSQGQSIIRYFISNIPERKDSSIFLKKMSVQDLLKSPILNYYKSKSHIKLENKSIQNIHQYKIGFDLFKPKKDYEPIKSEQSIVSNYDLKNSLINEQNDTQSQTKSMNKINNELLFKKSQEISQTLNKYIFENKRINSQILEMKKTIQKCKIDLNLNKFEYSN